MKEVTSVIYAEITVIAKVNDENDLMDEEGIAMALKNRLEADKVDVKQVKHFVMDEKVN